MGEIIDTLRLIISNVLKSLYQHFGAALTISVFIMFSLMYFEEHGAREALKILLRRIKTSRLFRAKWLFFFYLAMVLYRTLLCREIWMNPLSDVIGTWGIYKEERLYTANIENVLLFIPLTGLLLWVYGEKILKKNGLSYILLKTTCISFLFSLFIEFTQLFIKLGTFQLSDLFFNTVGGIFGTLIYWAICGRKNEKK